MTDDINKICCFETPITIVVAGSSKAGKTSWALRAVREADFLFVHKPRRIIWAYGKNCFDSKIASALREKWGNAVEFREGFPGAQIERGSLFKKTDFGLLILDDLALDVTTDTAFAKLFTQYSHHQNFRY